MARNYEFVKPGQWITGTVTRWPVVSGDNMLITIETSTSEPSPTVEQPNRVITVTEEFTTAINDAMMKDALRQAVSGQGKTYIEPGAMITIGYLGPLYEVKQWSITYQPPSTPRSLFGMVMSGVKAARTYLGLGGS